MKRFAVGVLGALLLTTLSARSAQAAPIIGGQLFANGGPVTATFLGSTAGLSNDLYLYAGDLVTLLYPTIIFNNLTSVVGSTVNLGTFADGTELVFAIQTNQCAGCRYFLGPGIRNPDLLPHGAVDNGVPPPSFPFLMAPPAGTTAVGFEDLFGGGDLDYDDLGFAFSNVRPTPAAVPEPASLFLLGSGLAAAAGRIRRRGQRAVETK